MITVMTPTYNRAYILGDVYESLKAQTSFDFEWIIVDDGSADETEQVVKKWMEEELNFSIVYEKQKNGGKHRAVNRGVALAKYDYFFILDSDDQLTADAVEKVHKWIADIADLDGFAGVAGLKGSEEKPVGGFLKKAYIDATNLERMKYGLAGDKAEVYKTDVLKQYPFPEFEGENFLRETASWDRIAKDGLKLRWYNEVIYLCEYIEDGLTKNTNETTYCKNFNGFLYCAKLYMQTYPWIYRLNKCGQFQSVARLKKITMRQSAKMLNVSVSFFVLGTFLFGLKQRIRNIRTQLKKG